MEIVTPVYPIDLEHYEIFFLYHLDKVYCAMAHLLERLPEITGRAFFHDLNLAITEVNEDHKRQVAKLEEIYIILDNSSSTEDCKYLISFMEEAFADIHLQRNDPILRDMAILFYLQNVESIEISSFKIMIMLANKLNNTLVIQLLRENLDDAKEASHLLFTISSRYLMQ